MKNPDFIIIGAGSAGCVLANRLSADGSTRVLLLEAGKSDKNSAIALPIPAAMGIPFDNEHYVWRYHTEPEPYLNNRRLYYPRGRILGGSSSVNGMVFLRGHPKDYEGWAACSGLAHWSYAHCLPYFKRLESSAHGADLYRGRNGPIRATLASCENPLHQAYLEAGEQAGHEFTDDVNGFRQEGLFRMEQSIRDGRRCSASFAYLHPVRSRPNLAIRTAVIVTKIIIENSRAIGVEFIDRQGVQRVHAEREIILSAGAFNSPQLLLLSGVGSDEQLLAHDIPVKHLLPGVGENLQEHLDIKLQYQCRQPVSLYRHSRGFGKLSAGLRWMLTRSGPAASNAFECGAFFRTESDVDFPNLQHHFVAIAFSGQGSDVVTGESYQVHLSQMRPLSRGSVRLKSANPLDPPLIRFNHLAEPEDLREIHLGLKLTRDIMSQKAFDPFRGKELGAYGEAKDDASLIQFAKERLGPSHHPSCTCKMGNDEWSVVDGECRVRGLSGLRVVDASIMPKIVSANINIPTIMIAEKAADLILGNSPASPISAPYFGATPQ